MKRKCILLSSKEYFALLKAANRAKKACTSQKKGRKRKLLYLGFMYDTDDDNTSSTESEKDKRLFIPGPIKSNIENHEQTSIGLILMNNERQQKVSARKVGYNNGQYKPTFFNRKQNNCYCTMRSVMA